jgi:hypothetical protein
MRPEAFECVDVTSGVDGLPFLSQQSSSQSASIFKLALLSTLAAAVVLPQLGWAIEAVAHAQTRSLIMARPLLAFELGLAVCFWIALFGWPLRRLVGNLNRRRDVVITRECVAVKDAKSFSQRVWTSPLRDYQGIAHHIRTSLGTTRHELILVHPDHGRSVLLMVGEHISEADISRFTRLLGLPEIGAAELYRLRRTASPTGSDPVWHETLATAA